MPLNANMNDQPKYLHRKDNPSKRLFRIFARQQTPYIYMKQITDTILMVRPARFGFNEQTAESNAFQNNDGRLSPEQIMTQARAEFDGFVEKLRAAGVEVIVAEDTPTPVKPDAVFPNNWVSFHEDGLVALYPMNTPNRRIERREDIIAQVAQQYEVKERWDLSHHELDGRFLEGTGSLLLDRPNKIAYACLGPRTDEGLLDEYCARLGYQKAAFHSVDGNGLDIYHTNVVMALGEDFVVICMDTVKNLRERALLLDLFEETGKAVIEISLDQMNHFAGNMLQVKSKMGPTYLVMSEQAYQSLTEDQIETLEEYTNLLPVPLYTIETYGGGSARCMMAEVFLQKSF